MRLQCFLTIAAVTGLVALGPAACRSKEKPAKRSRPIGLRPDPGPTMAPSRRPGGRHAVPRTQMLDPEPGRRVGSADAGTVAASADAGAVAASADAGAVAASADAGTVAASADAGAVVIPANASASDLYTLSRKAWLGGECDQAIQYARAANRKKFSRRHVSIIGACACTLRRLSTARWAYKILRGGHRNMLLQICRSKGIDLP